MQRYPIPPSLGFLSLVYAYFFDPRVRTRALLLAATVPIAIAANAARTAIMGLLGGGFHLLEGWVLFSVALSLVVAMHQCEALRSCCRLSGY